MVMLTFGQPIPVTMVVTRVIKPGLAAPFERWLHTVATEATGFEGHLGVHVIRPGPGSREYTIVYRFSGPGALRAWLESDIRAQRLREAEPMFEGEGRVQELSGLEAWFTLPGRGAPIPPSRFKMALVTFAAVYSLLTAVTRLFAPLLAPLPQVVRTPIVCAIVIGLMTYWVMPAITRLLARWLYPGDFRLLLTRR
jgi:antibiotic biosynthesis monooxygenase (ABM) superfamily enzyme